MAPLLQAEQLCKIYNRHRPDEVQAVKDVSLSVAAGEVVALTGPSGSGKTSLLSLLGCMARPTSGRIQVGGRDVARLPERFLARTRRELYGFVFQQFNLLRDLSVLDNLLLPLYPTELSGREMQRRADTVLSQLDLEKRRKHKVRQLSGGEQQRVAIARALINQPQLLIADEPSAHLDSRLTEELLQILAQLQATGKTIVIATHDPAIYQHQLIDRVVQMHDGRLPGDAHP